MPNVSFISNKPKINDVSIEDFIKKGSSNPEPEEKPVKKGRAAKPKAVEPKKAATKPASEPHAPPMIEEKVKFNVELPYTLRLHIKLLAAERRCPMNDLIVDALHEKYGMRP